MLNKKRVTMVIVACIIVYACVGGCSVGDRLSVRNPHNYPDITLYMGGFPSEEEYCRQNYLYQWEYDCSYDVEIIPVLNETEQESYYLHDVDPYSIVEKELSVNYGNADYLVIYLYYSGYSSPVYFWTIELDPDVEEYFAFYWMKYHAYVNLGVIDFGISHAFAIEVGHDGWMQLDFSLAPYYLFEFDYSLIYNIEIEGYVSDGLINVERGQFLHQMYLAYEGVQEEWDTTNHPFNRFLLITPADYSVYTTGIIWISCDYREE